MSSMLNNNKGACMHVAATLVWVCVHIQVLLCTY